MMIDKGNVINEQDEDVNLRRFTPYYFCGESEASLERRVCVIF